MGQTGSYTSKATVNPLLFTFTKWGAKEIEDFRLRGQRELADTFALRRSEFDFLLGKELVDFKILARLFEEVFDINRNKVVDKFELMSAICLLSQLSNTEKVHFFFDLFNFNNKGFLLEPEVSLLLISVTAGAFRVDPKFVPPPQSVLSILAETALSVARVDPGHSIRKPELVNFTIEVVEVNSFLEAWTGYAGQVLLRQGQYWRDASFPAADISIAEDREWLSFGLPTEGFTKWVRLHNLGPGVGTTALFSHTTNYLKTVDKRILYEGSGCIAGGTLKQGILADRWLLNGFSVCMGNPQLIAGLFALTGQERVGRYCIRLYEGFRWKSIFIDDRIPCSHIYMPLFSSSSNCEEAWPMILEKCAAKFLGSYGHLGVSAIRHDATLYGVRMLTGGHVSMYPCDKYVWQSVRDDVTRADAGELIEKWLAEGSLVSFGRSAPVALQASVLKAFPEGGPPCGYLFPVVGMKKIDGYKYFIMKDPWGYIVPTSATPPKVDTLSGHCRTYLVRIEELTKTYDAMMVCRFPDSLRDRAESLKLKKWKTEVSGQISHGSNDPSHFLLTVVGQLKEKPPVKTAAERFGEPKKKQVTSGRAQAAVKETEAKDDSPYLPVPVELSITFSSACEWMVAGALSAGATLRYRIVESTLASRQASAHHLQKQKRGKKHRKSPTRTEPAAASSSIDGTKDDTVHLDVGELKPDERAELITGKVSGVSSSGNTKPGNVERSKRHGSVALPSKEVGVGEVKLEGGRRCAWASIDIALPPGSYHVFVDVTFDAPREKLVKLVSEANAKTALHAAVPIPGADDEEDHPATTPDHEHPVDRTLLQVTSTGVFELKAVNRDEFAFSRRARGNLSTIPAHDNKWPFFVESQGEVASRGLLNMLSDLKDRAELLAVQHVNQVRKYHSLQPKIKAQLVDSDFNFDEETVDSSS